MNAGSRQFIDTNVVVYVYDTDDAVKRQRARALISELGAARRAALSIQVLQETYAALTRKRVPPLPADVALVAIRRLSAFATHRPHGADVVDAAELSIGSRISFWDGMLVTSASRMGCDVLWTEDLTHGQVIAGVEIRNPFLG